MHQFPQSSCSSIVSPTQAISACLRDLCKGTVYNCARGKTILASSKELLSTSLKGSGKHQKILIIKSESPYIAQLDIDLHESKLAILSGKVLVNSTILHSTAVVSSGELLTLGDLDNQFELVIRTVTRKLPRGPIFGLKLNTMEAPQKRSLLPFDRPLSTSLSESCLSTSYQMSGSLQQTLKRVSREVMLRKDGRKDPKQPLPPVYEQVGNSIGYQILLQSHPNVSEKLINGMYPLLKELHSSSEWLFNDYLDAYNESLKMKATPQCLHPSDLPTVKFLVDLSVHVSSLPPDSRQSFLKPDPSLWMQLLVIFSASEQNRQALVDHRCPSKIVGCMNLTSMADNKELQCHSWEILSSILTVPTPQDKKPPLHIQALTLLLSHVKRQFDQYSHRTDLIKAILVFLSTLCTTVRSCAINSSTSPDHPFPYSQSYAREVFKLIEESEINQAILDLPEFMQTDEIASHIQKILISLAPLPVPPRKIPPPKPKRSRCHTQIIFDPPKDLEQLSKLKVNKTTHRKLPEIPLAVTHSKSTENIFEQSSRLVSNKLENQSVYVTRRLPMSSGKIPVKSGRSQSIPENKIRILVTQNEDKSNATPATVQKPDDCMTDEHSKDLPNDEPYKALDMEASLPTRLSHTTTSSKSSLEHSLPPRYLKMSSSPLKESMYKRSSAMELIMPSHLMYGSLNEIHTSSTMEPSLPVHLAFDSEKPPNPRKISNEVQSLPVHLDPDSLDVAQSLPAHLDSNSLEDKKVESVEQSLPVHYTLPHDVKASSSDVELLASKSPKVESLSSPSVTDQSSLVSDTDSENSSINSTHDERSLRLTSPRPLSQHNRSSPTHERSSYIKAVTSSQQVSPQMTYEEIEHVITVSERKELLDTISGMWRDGRSMQAASKCIMGCFFSSSSKDLSLFADCLTCFCDHSKHWTIGVCIVLLPYMRQVLVTETGIRYVKVILNGLSFIIENFLSDITTIKKKSSHKADIEQKQACYHELHLVLISLSRISTSDVALSTMLDQIHKSLKPFTNPLSSL